jgi:hypothetical protein
MYKLANSTEQRKSGSWMSESECFTRILWGERASKRI